MNTIQAPTDQRPITPADARREAKAAALLTTAGSWLRVRHIAPDGTTRAAYGVPGSTPGRYWLATPDRCQCPDAVARGIRCKHRQAVSLYVAKVRAERAARVPVNIGEYRAGRAAA